VPDERGTDETVRGRAAHSRFTRPYRLTRHRLDSPEEPTVPDRSIPKHLPRRRGLTFVEVMISASILSIAAIASLELLAASDSGSLSARRQALAAVEAERTLAFVADLVKAGQQIPDSATLSGGLVGEALQGCSIVLTGTVLQVDFTLPPASAGGAPRTVDLAVNNLVAEVFGPNGELIIALERPVPLTTGEN
jgi:hypothetical protein